MYENQYLNGSRVVFEYDNNMLLSTTNSIYIPESGKWQPVDKEIRYYNEYEKDSIRLTQNWNAYNNQWENELMNKTFYNENEKDSLRLKQYWKAGTGQWVNQYKKETFYNDSLTCIDFYESIWNEVSQVWINDVHTHHEYSENDQLNTTTHYRWDINENIWVNDKKSTLLFNETGQILEYLSMIFNNQSNNWVNNIKLEYFYYDLNTESIRYDWDTINGNWKPEYRLFYSFAFDNITDTMQYELWDSISQQLVFSYRFINVFDHRLNQTKSLSDTWDSTDETWKTTQQTNYFWSPFNPLNIVEFEFANVKVYPNPARSSVIFSYKLPAGITLAHIEVRSTAGQLVAKLPIKQAESKQVLNTSKLPCGIYVYTFITSRVIATGKFVIAR